MTTQKPAKKARRKKSMAKFIPYTKKPPDTIYAAFTDDRMYHVSTQREWSEDAASEMPDGKPFKVFAYSLSPSDRKIEEVKKWCENAIAYDRLTNAGTLVFARDILRILNNRKAPR